MRILEILLPKGASDRSLSPRQQQQIGMLQKRMTDYVDKIMSPHTSQQGKDFLKSRLRDDYYELKGLLPHTHEVAEGIIAPQRKAEYEIFDRETNQRLPGTDVFDRVLHANRAVNELEPQYGKYRIGYRPVKKTGVAETDEIPLKSAVQYEVYDRRTGEKVPGRGPYATKSRARLVVDKLDNEYGAYRYGYRPVGGQKVTEAVHKVPITNDDFEGIKFLMNRPIPAVVAMVYLQDSIVDDEFNDELRILEETDPNRDVRPLVVEWFRRVMPDQMFHFTGEDPEPDLNFKRGILSPIHGYDPRMYKGTNPPITGDAYGFL